MELEIELENIHLTILFITVLMIIYSDHRAFAYLRGKIPTLPYRQTKWLHRIVWTGLLLMIATGFTMFWPERAHYLSESEFLLKMFFVLVLIVNGYFIGRLTPISSMTPFRELSRRKRFMLLASGTASTIGWLGAATIGLFFL